MRIALRVWLICGVLVSSQAQSSTQQTQPPPATSNAEREADGHTIPIEVLSDTKGVDLKPYLGPVLKRVQQNWYGLVPPSARAPLKKKGDVSIEFHIFLDGNVSGMAFSQTTGDADLDRAAWEAITSSSPFQPLPPQFVGEFLALRFNFHYNPDGLERKADPPRPPLLMLEKGFVDGGTYKNGSIGLEFSPAPPLVLGKPEVKGLSADAAPLVTIGAWGDANKFSARQGTVFYADPLFPYPADQRSTGAYLKMVIKGNQTWGFELLESGLKDEMGGFSFARADFKRGVVYEAILVKACATDAFVFVFTGSRREAVNALIGASHLKFDSAAGCHAEI